MITISTFTTINIGESEMTVRNANISHDSNMPSLTINLLGLNLRRIN